VTEPLWIDERDAVALHERFIALDGGAAGVRDFGLLESALARPRQLHSYGDNPDLSTSRLPTRPELFATTRS
jgi:death-on-curing protein